MPPSAEDRLQDILGAIEELQTYMHGADFQSFSANRPLRLMTERLLQIICEAARNLPDDTRMDASDIDWRKMADFGNQLRHAYHSTKIELVWDVVQDHIPPLKAFVESRIRE